MGIELVCKKQSYSCSYGNWNAFRLQVMEATISYLKAKFYLQDCEVEPQDEEDQLHREQLADFVRSKPTSTDMKWKYNDSLIHYGLGGLFSFCMKADCSGYYSVGNAYDICELFRMIEPMMEKDLENPNRIEEIVKLFQESVDTRTKIALF